MADTITFTTRMGHFEFDKEVVLSRAKLVRDAITGQFFCPKPDAPKIKNEGDAYRYAATLSRDLADIPFDLNINVVD